MISLDITISTPAIQMDVQIDVAQSATSTPIDLAHGSDQFYNP